MQKLYKIIIYVPETHAAKLRDAIAKAGAGKLGNYEACSFSAKGIGRFRPLEGAKPFLGEQGKIEEVKEERIEVVAIKEDVKKIIKAIRETHPYEEPAFEILELKNHEFED
ncbi:MAG: hypothetical protein ABIE94_06400 [archaeon]